MKSKLGKNLKAWECFSFPFSDSIYQVNEGAKTATLICDHGFGDAILIEIHPEDEVFLRTMDQVKEHRSHDGFRGDTSSAPSPSP